MTRTFFGGHFDQIFVNVGDRVKKGQPIGTLGHTGYTEPPGRSGEHLHFVILRKAEAAPFWMEQGPGLGANKADTEDFARRLQFKKHGKIVPSRISQGYGNVKRGVVHYAIDILVDYYDNAEILWPEEDGVVVSVKDFGGSRTGKTLMIQYGGMEPDPEGIYTVRKGDTLGKIALEKSVSVQELIEANKNKYPSLVNDPDFIDIGWKFAIPKEKPDPKAQPGDIVRISPDAADQIFGNPHLVVEGEEVDGLTWVRVGISDKWILDK